MQARSLARRAVGWNPVGIVTVVALFLVSAPGAAITFGTIDTEHTNVGAILFFSLRLNRWVEFCSGTLVSERVFLTAGHCTDGLAVRGAGPDRIRVSFSLHLFAKNAKWLEIETYASHPDYNWGPTSDPHDVGVIILAKPVRDLAPATLGPVGYLDGLEATEGLRGTKFAVVGYGTDENIQATNVRMIAFSEFLSLHEAWLYMSQNPFTGDSGTCFGDSGGPTFHSGASGEVLVAVTSWGDAVCIATGINYRIDIATSQAFIQDVVATYG